MANISTSITLYELLEFCMSTKKALREALTDAKIFMAQIPVHLPHEGQDILHTSQDSIYINLSPKDMQNKEKHDWPLYFTGYDYLEVGSIQVDIGSALRIMPCWLMQYLGIPIHSQSATQATIYGFNANGTRPLGKIKLKYQVWDLKSEVICYVIYADTSYNLLLGGSVHCNYIIPSILRQVTKYTNEGGKVRTQLLKGIHLRG